MNQRVAARALLTVACVLFAQGCVRRTLAVRSNPPGAELFINGQRVGETPFLGELQWYGWYRVALAKPGYERIEDQVELRAPLHLWIPLDLVMELLPVQIKDPNVLEYQMIPNQPIAAPTPPPEVLNEARQERIERLGYEDIGPPPEPKSKDEPPTVQWRQQQPAKEDD